MLRTGLVAGMVLMMSSLQAHAQSSVGVAGEVERWSVESGSQRTSETRWGGSLGIGVWGETGFAGARVGWVPQGDVEPGWVEVAAKVGPRFSAGGRLHIGFHGSAGAFRMNVGNRHDVIEACRPEEGCQFNAPALEDGWGFSTGAGLNASVEVYRDLRVTAEYGWNWILAGANSDERLTRSQVGVTYELP